MAYAHHHCCAFCDRKMNYNHNAFTKDDLCEDCQRALVEAGISVFNGEDLAEWIRERSEETVHLMLEEVDRPFNFCHYENAVDNVVADVLGCDPQGIYR